MHFAMRVGAQFLDAKQWRTARDRKALFCATIAALDPKLANAIANLLRWSSAAQQTFQISSLVCIQTPEEHAIGSDACAIA